MTVELGFLLHAYQPWWQFPEVLEKITTETYNPNFRKLISDERYSLSLNINSVLPAMFHEKIPEMNSLIQELINLERIDITSSSAYHSFLPLVSREHAEFQIDLQQKQMSDLFENYSPRGFHLPEMGYSEGIEELLEKKGFVWTVVEDQPFIAHHNKNPPYNWIASSKGFPVLMRSKFWSFDNLAKNPPYGLDYLKNISYGMQNWTNGDDAYIVIALDFETFDHHHKNSWDRFFLPLLDNLENYNMRLSTLSDIAEKFPKKEYQIPKGSWSTSMQEYRDGNFYPLWNSPFYSVHKDIWDLYRLAEDSVKNNPVPEAMIALAKGTNSCTWWQIPLGNPHLMKYGVGEMINAISLSKGDIKKAKEISEKIYSY